LSDEEPYEPRSGQKVVEDLDQAARGVQKAAFELSSLVNDFYGTDGIGIKLKVAVDEEKLHIWESAIQREERPPPADIREAMAEKFVRERDPMRWSEYVSKKARIEALKLWMSNLKGAMSANQSLRREFGDGV